MPKIQMRDDKQKNPSSARQQRIIEKREREEREERERRQQAIIGVIVTIIVMAMLVTVGVAAVSYTHLTLPTIYSV